MLLIPWSFRMKQTPTRLRLVSDRNHANVNFVLFTCLSISAIESAPWRKERDDIQNGHPMRCTGCSCWMAFNPFHHPGGAWLEGANRQDDVTHT